MINNQVKLKDQSKMETNLKQRAEEIAKLHLEGLEDNKNSGYESIIYCFSLLNENSFLFYEELEDDIPSGLENFDNIPEKFNEFKSKFPGKVEKLFEKVKPNCSYEVVYKIGGYRYYFSDYAGYYEFGGDVEFLRSLLSC